MENEKKLVSIKRDYIDRNTLAELLDEWKIGVRHNELSQEIEITGKIHGENPEYLRDDAVAIIADDVRRLGYKGSTEDRIAGFLRVIAHRNAYNPFAELIDGATWDGRDHIGHACDVLGIPADDELSRKLFDQWLRQGIYLTHNTNTRHMGADGVLILQGAQGTGKTSFFRHLAMQPQFFREGQTIDPRDKDTTRRCVTCAIAELGEIESTFKSEVEMLRNFVTADFDEYRLPYGRQDIRAPRRTNLCGTCNSNEFLVDPYGNRRWWVIPIAKRVPYTEIREINALQCWAQAVAEVGGDYAAQRLTGDMIDAIEGRAKQYLKPERGEAEIRDALEKGRYAPIGEHLVSDWLDHEGIRMDASAAGRILTRLGYPVTRRAGQGRYRMLPWRDIDYTVR